MGTPNTPATSVSTKQVVRQIITSTLAQHFGSTLNTVPDIVNIVMGICQQEASLNPNITFHMEPHIDPKTGAGDYWYSTPVQNILLNGSGAQKANVTDGSASWGIMQVMGYNIVRGGSLKSHKCLFETLKNPAAAGLLINAGDSIRSVLFQQATLQNQILAGLLVLESKWLIAGGKKSGNSYSINGCTFSSQIALACAGYNGWVPSTAYRYSASVMTGGHSYTIANGPGGGSTSTSNPNQANPQQTIASGNNQVPPGC
jgi:hypothetical protein